MPWKCVEIKRRSVVNYRITNKTCLGEFVLFEGTNCLDCVFIERKLNTACHGVDVQNNCISLVTDFADYA